MFLYHYTTMEALLGMIHKPDNDELQEIEVNKDSSYGYYLILHATDAYMMNDKMEHKLILEEMSDAVKRYDSKFQYETLSCGKPYIVSFCKEKDYLPMWQIYAKGGNGICLVFEIEENNSLYQLNESNNGNSFKEIKLCDCMYVSKVDLQQLKDKWTKSIKAVYENASPSLISPETPFLNLYKEAVVYKSKEWEYEKEKRLVCWTMYPNIKKGKNGICPYVAVKMPLRCLKEIIIGPSPNQDINAYAIKEMIKVNGWYELKDYGIDINVTESEIALR